MGHVFNFVLLLENYISYQVICKKDYIGLDDIWEGGFCDEV